MRNRLNGIPGPDQPHLEQRLDIQMMVSGLNRECTEPESVNLLEKVGFEYIETYQNEGAPVSVVETTLSDLAATSSTPCRRSVIQPISVRFALKNRR
jgi:hypothetical protein